MFLIILSSPNIVLSPRSLHIIMTHCLGYMPIQLHCPSPSNLHLSTSHCKLDINGPMPTVLSSRNRTAIYPPTSLCLSHTANNRIVPHPQTVVPPTQTVMPTNTPLPRSHADRPIVPPSDSHAQPLSQPHVNSPLIPHQRTVTQSCATVLVRCQQPHRHSSKDCHAHTLTAASITCQQSLLIPH